MTKKVTFKDQLKKNDFDVCLFDMDGTLYSSTAQIEHQIIKSMQTTTAEYLDISVNDAIKLLQKYRAMFKSSILGLEQYHGVNPYYFYDDVYAKLDTSKMSPYIGLRDALVKLKKHLPLYVMTNSNRSFTERVLMELSLNDVFDKVFTVEDNDFIRKPNKEAYENILLNQLEVNYNRAVMFDDIASSLKVISNLGMTTVLVGNGLIKPPGFIDLHTREEFANAPDFINYSTHNLVDFIESNI